MQIKLNSREVATVLAALREFQHYTFNFPLTDIKRGWPEHFVEVEPLTRDDIDELCERLNLAERNPHA